MIDKYEKELKDLKEKLNKANKIIDNQRIEIQALKEKINSFKNNKINQLEQQIKNMNLNNVRNNLNNQINREDIKVVNFISSEQNLFYAISCSGNDTFAEVEEKLYKEYPEYRETNNTFLANGKEILRFKTINDNKIGTGKPIMLLKPS